MDNKNKSLSNLENEKVDGEKIKGGFGGLTPPTDPGLPTGGLPGDLPPRPEDVDNHDPANQPGGDDHPLAGQEGPGLHPPGPGMPPL